MCVEAHCEALARVIHLDVPIERIVTGFEFTEGPIWHPAERTLVFSDILGNTLYRWSAREGLSKLRLNSYMANGNAYDPAGRIVTCEHATSRITRTDFARGGDLEVLATHFEGKQLNSPNDVIVKRDGMIYFTDPPSGRGAAYGVPRAPELSFSGVYRLQPDSGELTLLVEDFAKPNGLCFSTDERTLYINDTARQHIRAFDVLADGTLGNGRLFAHLDSGGLGVADGMKIDQENHLYCVGPGGVHIFDPAGRCLGKIKTPEYATNLVFGDDDGCTLYITASTSIYRIRVQIPGAVIFAPDSTAK